MVIIIKLNSIVFFMLFIIVEDIIIFMDLNCGIVKLMVYGLMMCFIVFLYVESLV